MRLRFIEVECDGPAVAEIVRALSVPPEVMVRMPAIEPPAAETPKKAPRAPRQLKAAKPAQEDKEPGTSPYRLAPLALSEGPKSSREVAEWISLHGIPGYSTGKASACLTYLKKRCQVKTTGTGQHVIWSRA